MNNSNQTTFINTLVTEKSLVSVYLTNGIKLVGTIESHDDTSIILTKDKSRQLVFKTAISTIIKSS